MTTFYAIQLLNDDGHYISLAYYQSHSRALRALKKYPRDSGQWIQMVTLRFRDDGDEDA